MGQAALGKCPICGKPSAEKYRPFCSARCADIDLGRWLGERYKMPTEETPADNKNESEDSDGGD